MIICLINLNDNDWQILTGHRKHCTVFDPSFACRFNAEIETMHFKSFTSRFSSTSMPLVFIDYKIMRKQSFIIQIIGMLIDDVNADTLISWLCVLQILPRRCIIK